MDAKGGKSQITMDLKWQCGNLLINLHGYNFQLAKYITTVTADAEPRRLPGKNGGGGGGAIVFSAVAARPAYGSNPGSSVRGLSVSQQPRVDVSAWLPIRQWWTV